MQSFRQSNPIDNINELQENIELTQERLMELDKRLYDQIPVMLEIPSIRQLVILNLELVLKYFKMQITLNEFLNKKFGDVSIANYYFKFIIDLNNRYEIKIEEMLGILKNAQKEKYNEIIELIKMYSLPFYLYVLGNNMPKLTAKDICMSLTKNIDDITLDPEKIKQGLRSMSEKIQSQITKMETNVTDIVSKIEVPEPEDLDKKISEIQGSITSKFIPPNKFNKLDNKRKSRTKLNNNNKTHFLNGGSIHLYNSIYDPIHNEWVNTNSRRGRNIINTYVVNLILE
jgi:hypothetical protein